MQQTQRGSQGTRTLTPKDPVSEQAPDSARRDSALVGRIGKEQDAAPAAHSAEPEQRRSLGASPVSRSGAPSGLPSQPARPSCGARCFGRCHRSGSGLCHWSQELLGRHRSPLPAHGHSARGSLCSGGTTALSWPRFPVDIVPSAGKSPHCKGARGICYFP
jgi:hypothetical protein